MMKGMKLDDDKTVWDLMPWHELKEVADVLTFGADKYGAWNWILVDEGESRYFSALIRHITAYKMGEKKDDESDLSHLAHAACCILFLMYFERKKNEL